jgi:hypothetical protein
MTMSGEATSERNSDHPKVEMVVLEINYGKGRKDDIVVYYGDDPRDLAKQFVEKHSLKVSAISAICTTLEQTIADFKAENEPSSYFESPDSVVAKNEKFTAEEETKEEFVTEDEKSQNFKKQLSRPEDYKGQPPIELLVNGSPRIPTFDHSDENVRLLNEQVVQFPTTLFAPEAQSAIHHGRNLASHSSDNLDRYSPARRHIAANRDTNRAVMSPVISPIVSSTVNTDFNFTDDEPLLFAEENPSLHSSKPGRLLPLQGEMRPSPRTRSLSSSVFPNLFVVDRSHGHFDASNSKDTTLAVEGQILKSNFSAPAKGSFDGNEMITVRQDVASIQPVQNKAESFTDVEVTAGLVTPRAVTIRTGYDEIPRSSPPPPPSESPLSVDYDFFRPRSFDFEVVRNKASNEEFDMVEKLVHTPVAVLPDSETNKERPVGMRMFDYFGSNLSGKEVQALGDNTVYSEASPFGEGYSAASAPLTISPRMHGLAQAESGDHSPGLSSYERVPSPSGSSYSSNSRTVIAEKNPKLEADDANVGLTEHSLGMSDSAVLSRRESFEDISVITLIPSPKRNASVSPVLRYARGQDDLDSEPSVGVSSSVMNVPMMCSRPSSPSHAMNINSGSQTPERASVKDSASVTPEGSIALGIEHFYESPGHMATGLSSKAGLRSPGIVARPASAPSSRSPAIARWDMQPVSVGSSRDQPTPRWVAQPVSVGSSRDQSISRWDQKPVSLVGGMSGDQSPSSRDMRPASVGSSRGQSVSRWDPQPVSSSGIMYGDQSTPRWVAQPVSVGSSRDQSISRWDPQQPSCLRVSGDQSLSNHDARPASVGSSRSQSVSLLDMQPVSVRVSRDQPISRWDPHPASVGGRMNGDQSQSNRDVRPASVRSSVDQSVSLLEMPLLSVSVSRDESPSEWAFTADDPDDEEARFNALKSMCGRNSSLIPSSSTLTLNKTFKPETDQRWDPSKKITPNPVLPPGHRLYDSAGKSRIKREKKILEVAEEKSELRRTSLFTVSGASVGMLNNNISSGRDADVCSRLYNNGIRELELKKNKAKSRRIEWSCVRCGVYQVYNPTSPPKPSSTDRRCDTDSADTGRLSARSNLASSVSSEVEISFSAPQICRKCGYDQNILVGPAVGECRGDSSAVFCEDSYGSLGNSRTGYQKPNMSDCSSSSRGQSQSSRPTIHDSLYANKKREVSGFLLRYPFTREVLISAQYLHLVSHCAYAASQTVMRRAIQISSRNQAADYTFR